MQLIETNFHRGEGTTAGEFVGEGGAKASVCMVAHKVPEDAAVSAINSNSMRQALI